MPEISLTINGAAHSVSADANTPLLWILRDWLGLTGTKFGCGIGQCGACTVLLDGDAARSCVTPAISASGHAITTIEGLSSDAQHPVQQAWLAESVSQCGYCQAGEIMTAVALLKKNPKPSDTDIDSAYLNHLCRCGTYERIRRAVHRVARGG